MLRVTLAEILNAQVIFGKLDDTNNTNFSGTIVRSCNIKSHSIEEERPKKTLERKNDRTILCDTKKFKNDNQSQLEIKSYNLHLLHPKYRGRFDQIKENNQGIVVCLFCNITFPIQQLLAHNNSPSHLITVSFKKRQEFLSNDKNNE